MEFVEILAFIKKVIFLVGGACVVILLYYRYGKQNKKIVQEPVKEEAPPKDDSPAVNVRRHDFGEQQLIDPSQGIDIDPMESEWVRQEKSPLDEFLMDEMSPERRSEMIEVLKENDYHGTFVGPESDDYTDMNADPFED